MGELEFGDDVEDEEKLQLYYCRDCRPTGCAPGTYRSLWYEYRGDKQEAVKAGLETKVRMIRMVFGYGNYHFVSILTSSSIAWVVYLVNRHWRDTIHGRRS